MKLHIWASYFQKFSLYTYKPLSGRTGPVANCLLRPCSKLITDVIGAN